MLTFDPEPRMVTMTLVDLEHCGFDHADFDFELACAGIEDPAARWPVALVVNFVGGHVVGPATTPETRARLADAAAAFDQLVADWRAGARRREACQAARAFVEREIERLRAELLDVETPIPQDEVVTRSQVLGDLARQLDAALDAEK